MDLPYIIPSPSEGILSCFLRNGVFLLSLVKGIVRITLYMFGIYNISSLDTLELYPAELFEFSESFELLASVSGSSTYIEEIKSQTPTLRFDTLCCYKQGEVECIVCLIQFEPESEINLLSCGHIFHKVCLEKWLNYRNITCPLCRAVLTRDVDQHRWDCVDSSQELPVEI